MSLFNDASLVMIPSGYKEDTVYSVKPTDGSGDLTFTRASTATRVNSSGNIESVSTGVPRLDYSNGCPSLLLEPQRTNSFTYSESFANYYFNRATATDLGTPSIFSSGSIARFTATAADARFGKVIVSVTSGSTYTVSGFFDLSEGIYAGISDSSGNYRIFNLLTASVVGSGGGTLTISCKSDRVALTNYYRVAFTFTANTTGNHFFVIGKNDGTINTANETVAAGYFQREDSASYPTSYIPTTSASVTRVADAASKTGISSLIGQTEGVVFLDSYFDETDKFNLSVNDGTSSNFIQIETTSGSAVVVDINSGGVSQASLSTSSSFFTSGQRLKIAIAYKSNDFALYINGVQIATDLSGSVPSTDRFICARYNGARSASQRINQLILFKTRLTNAELASLTTL